VGTEPERFELRARPAERVVVCERAQHLVVGAARFVGAREDRVDDAQPTRRADALIGDAVAGTRA
jgi:hypothetical protein